MKDKDNESGIKESEYLNSIPGMEKSILEGINTPLQECTREDNITFKND